MPPRQQRSRTAARPATRKKAPRAQSGREAILAAAVSEFAQKGYEGATTASIARAAGVTQPLVHHHFTSKEELWKTTVDHIYAQLREGQISVIDELKDLDPESRLKVLVRHFVTFSARHPELAQIVGREGSHDTERLAWMVQTHIRPMLKNLRAFAGAADQKLVKHLAPAFLLFVILGAGAEIFTVPALVKRLFGIDVTAPESVREHADVLVEVLFHGVADRIAKPR